MVSTYRTSAWFIGTAVVALIFHPIHPFFTTVMAIVAMPVVVICVAIHKVVIAFEEVYAVTIRQDRLVIAVEATIAVDVDGVIFEVILPILAMPAQRGEVILTSRFYPLDLTTIPC
jgi:hypothetical protein